MEGVVTARPCDLIRGPTLTGRDTDADGQDANPASKPLSRSTGQSWRRVQAVFRPVRARILTAFALSPSKEPSTGLFAAAPTGAAG